MLRNARSEMELERMVGPKNVVMDPVVRLSCKPAALVPDYGSRLRRVLWEDQPGPDFPCFARRARFVQVKRVLFWLGDSPKQRLAR